MYGTVARIEVQPDKVDEFIACVQRQAIEEEHISGYIGSYVFRLDSGTTRFNLVAIFDSREAYVRNAQDPAQDKRYQEMRALTVDDPT